MTQYIIPKNLPNTLPLEVWSLIFYWKWRLETGPILKELLWSLKDYKTEFGGVFELITSGDIWLSNKCIKTYKKKYRIKPYTYKENIVNYFKKILCSINRSSIDWTWNPNPGKQIFNLNQDLNNIHIYYKPELYYMNKVNKKCGIELINGYVSWLINEKKLLQIYLCNIVNDYYSNLEINEIIEVLQKL